MRWKKAPASSSVCWSASTMFPPWSATNPAMAAASPGRSGAASRRRAVTGSGTDAT